jgi:hypothetical protein
VKSAPSRLLSTTRVSLPIKGFAPPRVQGCFCVPTAPRHSCAVLGCAYAAPDSAIEAPRPRSGTRNYGRGTAGDVGMTAAHQRASPSASAAHMPSDRRRSGALLCSRTRPEAAANSLLTDDPLPIYCGHLGTSIMGIVLSGWCSKLGAISVWASWPRCSDSQQRASGKARVVQVGPEFASRKHSGFRAG